MNAGQCRAQSWPIARRMDWIDWGFLGDLAVAVDRDHLDALRGVDSQPALRAERVDR